GRRVFSANVPRLPPAAEASSLISLRRPASHDAARLAGRCGGRLALAARLVQPLPFLLLPRSRQRLSCRPCAVKVAARSSPARGGGWEGAGSAAANPHLPASQPTVTFHALKPLM